MTDAYDACRAADDRAAAAAREREARQRKASRDDWSPDWDEPLPRDRNEILAGWIFYAALAVAVVALTVAVVRLG